MACANSGYVVPSLYGVARSARLTSMGDRVGLNLRLPSDLHHQLKDRAAQEDRSLTNLIIRALREWLALRKEKAA